MELKILRLSTDKTVGTRGVLLLNGNPIGTTLEPYKYGNIINSSCIPTGQYSCERYYSKKFKYDTVRVMNVPLRSAIVMHKGTTLKNTKGCVLVGDGFSDNGIQGDNIMALLSSLFKGTHDNIRLTIVECY